MKSLDSLFPYPTVKIARIPDGTLGLLRYGLTLLIFVYVVGYQILWKGSHLEMKELTGVHQLQFDHPTLNNCDDKNVECMQNFTSLSKLSYCAQSPISAPIKLPCQYWDAHQLGQLAEGDLMIPTHVSTFYQRSGCKPSAANNWTCVGWIYDFLDKKGHVQSKPRGQASPASEIFVADVERFTLTIDHSVRSTLGHRYYASEMVGYVLDCTHENQSDAGCVPRPIHCAHGRCRPHTLAQNRASVETPSKFRGDRRSLSLAGVKPARPPNSVALDDSVAFLQLQSGEELLRSLQPASLGLQSTQAATTSIPPSPAAPGRANDLESLGVVSLAEGDMFTIGTLLKAANVSLDRRRHHVPSWVGGTYRSSGFVLVIRVHYSNIESWLGAKVLPWNILGPTMHYTYRITKHASHDDFMVSKVHAGGANAPKHSRVLTEFNGIRVLVEQSGNVAVWDNIQLLLILTTTLALMAVSTCITDTIAMNCLPQSDRYWKIKFEFGGKAKDDQETEDFEASAESSGARTG